MLPKVANQLINASSRAVAAAQYQSYALRNVLQLQTSGPSSTSGNIWNGVGPSTSNRGSSINGTVPNGSKHNPSSRYYNGHTATNSGITHPTASSSKDTDGTPVEHEESEEIQPRLPGRSRRRGSGLRSRSHSLSLGLADHADLSVLKTLQLHARSKHALAAPCVPSLDHARQNSSLAATDSNAHSAASLHPQSLSSAGQSSAAVLSTDPVAPQTIQAPKHPGTGDDEGSIYRREIASAYASGDYNHVQQVVRNLRESSAPMTTKELNEILDALAAIRPSDKPLHSLLETYNYFASGSKPLVIPNVETHAIMLTALATRDYEIHRSLSPQEASVTRRSFIREKSDALGELTKNVRSLKLEAQSTYKSITALYDAVSAADGILSIDVHTILLRSCSYRGDIDRAIAIFSHLEAIKDDKFSPYAFLYLVATYATARDLAGARVVFEEFREATKRNRIAWNKGIFSREILRSQIWNKMIDAHFACGDAAGALGLLEQMIDAPERPMMKHGSLKFVPEDPPLPSQSTFTHIIIGFCSMGDLNTAISWFKRLLSQPMTSSNVHLGSREPTRPSRGSWNVLVNSLLHADKVPEFYDLYKMVMERDPAFLTAADRMLLAAQVSFYVREQQDAIDPKVAISMLDITAEHTLAAYENSKASDDMYLSSRMDTVDWLQVAYMSLGDLDGAIGVVEKAIFVSRVELAKKTSPESLNFPDAIVTNAFTVVRKLASGIPMHHWPKLSFALGLRLLRLAISVDLRPTLNMSSALHHTYKQARKADLDALTSQEWEMFILSANLVSSDALVEVLKDLSWRKAATTFFQDIDAVARVANAFYRNHTANEVAEILSHLPSEQESALKRSEEDSESVISSSLSDAASHASEPTFPETTQKIQFDVPSSQAIEEAWRTVGFDALGGSDKINSILASGSYPTYIAVGRVINGLGRISDIERMRRMYEIAKVVVSATANKYKMVAWTMIESQMVIGYAHAGLMDDAFMHRARILERGCVPSADAYGALIQNVKDTTDDTSNAMGLFQEAVAGGRRVNTYLYNTIISKLSRARRADEALELFSQMKASRIAVSSITYGALIAACCRVGDTQSAEMLFQEMTEQPNFKPRVPPYNTMMQMYAHIKPNRDKVLFYFGAMTQAGIKPTVHSYKLLLDAYGSVEPVDTDGMMNVLKEIELKGMRIQGVHWASVINAWGCVKKDFDRVIKIFETLENTSNNSPLPDAITYEALFNVLVTHRRSDLLPQYIARLEQSGIHMTAYIANLIIKDHALGGRLNEARAFFESLADPPEGVAATGNHAPHTDEEQQLPVEGPVYREPSTWESMIRAELGAGNREHAIALLKRLEARKFPAAVYKRISGIMLDNDAVSPWPATLMPDIPA